MALPATKRDVAARAAVLVNTDSMNTVFLSNNCILA